MNGVTALVVALLLLAGNAFFVGAEFALVSARRTQIEPRAATGARSARTTLRAMDRVSLMMAGAQLGITVCSLGLGAVAEPAVAHLLEGPLEAAGLPEGLVHPVAFAVALMVVVALHMVLGEMVPKNIALAGPERAALALGPLLYGVVLVLHPLIRLLNLLANAVLRLLHVQPKDEVTTAYDREEVAGLVSESRQEGLLDEDEHHLLSGALGFVEHRAADVAIALDALVSVGPRVTTEELEVLCVHTGYSRFPLRGEDGSDLVGYVHVKDLLDVPVAARTAPVPRERVRPLPTVTADDSLRDVLATMQRRGAHLARVGAADGRALVGVAALEDVIEELVGEVRDATQPPPGTS